MHVMDPKPSTAAAFSGDACRCDYSGTSILHLLQHPCKSAFCPVVMFSARLFPIANHAKSEPGAHVHSRLVLWDNPFPLYKNGQTLKTTAGELTNSEIYLLCTDQTLEFPCFYSCV